MQEDLPQVFIKQLSLQQLLASKQPGDAQGVVFAIDSVFINSTIFPGNEFSQDFFKSNTNLRLQIFFSNGHSCKE